MKHKKYLLSSLPIILMAANIPLISTGCAKKDSKDPHELSEEDFSISNGVLYGLKEGTNISKITTITIPKSVNKIAIGAFKDVFVKTQENNDLTLKIGNHVAEIENEAFSGCNSITTLDMSEWNEMPEWHGQFIFRHWETTGTIIYSEKSSKVTQEQINSKLIDCGLPHFWIDEPISTYSVTTHCGEGVTLDEEKTSKVAIPGVPVLIVFDYDSSIYNLDLDKVEVVCSGKTITKACQIKNKSISIKGRYVTGDVTVTVAIKEDETKKGIGYITDNVGAKHYFKSITETNFCDNKGTDDIVIDGTTYPRNTFNLPIHFLNNISLIPSYFLKNCTSFNSTITYDGSMMTFEMGFLYGCTSFNQKLNFTKLKKIGESFLEGCTSFNQDIETLHSYITNINNSFLKGCTSFNSKIDISSASYIGDNFMEGCSLFNQKLMIPSNCGSIGDNFLKGCTSFNQQLGIPELGEASVNIGSYFMYGCKSFNSLLFLAPNTNMSFARHFLCECDSMQNIVHVECDPSSTPDDSFSTTNVNADCYTKGIKIASTHEEKAQAFLDTFTESTESPYRKLIKGTLPSQNI